MSKDTLGLVGIGIFVVVSLAFVFYGLWVALRTARDL